MYQTAGLPTRPPTIPAAPAPAALRDIRLLVVADAGGGSAALSRALSVFGIDVVAVPDGRRMHEWLETRECDAVLLVPPIRDDDAVAACARLRRRFPGIGVLMLSARADSLDKVVGLEAGADDYLHADCDPRELVARLRAVMRRLRAEHAADKPEWGVGDVRVGGWSFDPGGRRLSSPQTGDVRLTAGETRLLAELSSQPGRTVPRTRLQELTGGRHAGATDRSVDLLVSRLRQKLGDDPRAPRLIRTVRGRGYTFAAPAERMPST